jgi:hypothetical protein
MRTLGGVTTVARTKAAPATNPRMAIWAGRSVPTRLRTLTAAAVVLALALLGFLAAAVRDARAGLDLIGHHSGPVVVSTSNLYFALSDMDAQVANVLLVGDRADLGVARNGAINMFHQRRSEVDGYLQQTAAYAGRDPAAGRDLRQVLDALSRYHGLAAQAILVQSQHPAEPGRPAAQAVELYRQATDLMHRDLLRAALRLTDDEAAQVEHEYAHAKSSVESWITLVVLFGILLLGVLAALQISLARHHHRVVNPAIAVATLATLVLVFTGFAAVDGANTQLGIAKHDAFDYALALHRARAVSYDANADESRYLLDPARADRYEAEFHAKSQRIVQTPAGSVAGYDAALAALVARYNADHVTVAFDGYLGQALRHVTFAGEREVGERILARYQAYQAADRRMRELVRVGDLVGAIRFCMSSGPGDSNGLFFGYDQALSELIALNERAFKDAVTAGENILAGWAWIPPITMILVAALVVIGAAPRLAEYRG